MSDPEDHVMEAVRGELKPDAASAILETDTRGPAFGVLGLDSEDRVVWYGDDGSLFRFPLVDGEPIRDYDHPGRERESLRAIPHNGEGAVVALNTDDWNWIHPRYRWLTDHAPGRKLETEAEG